MTKMTRFVCVVAIGVSLLVGSSANAGWGGRGYYRGGYGWGWGWGWGPAAAVGAVAVGTALAYDSYYYPYTPGYYYAQQPVYYAPQTVVYSAQPEVVYSSPTVNYEPQRPAQPSAPAPSVQTQPAQTNTQKPSMTVDEVKALVKGGLSDEVILSQIRSSHAVFHLTTDEILDLNANKVSQKVIEFMINTASTR